MSGSRLVTVFGAAMLVLPPLLVEAHHSAIMFEDQKEVTFEGVVKEFQFTKLTITGHPMKDGRPAALWVKAVRADGMEFYPGGRRAGRGGQ